MKPETFIVFEYLHVFYDLLMDSTSLYIDLFLTLVYTFTIQLL